MDESHKLNVEWQEPAGKVHTVWTVDTLFRV